MSFDITPPNKNLSNVQASAKSCAGGGGNTGYFRRDGGSESEQSKHQNEELFDTFERDDVVLDEEQDIGLWTSFLRYIEKFVNYIKNFFISKLNN